MMNDSLIVKKMGSSISPGKGRNRRSHPSCDISAPKLQRESGPQAGLCYDTYIDSNLDWSFCKLTPQMVKLLQNDWSVYVKRKSEEEGSSNRFGSRFHRSIRRLTKTKSLRKRISKHGNQDLEETIKERINNWNFNTFEVSELVGRHTMMPITRCIFLHHDLLNKFHIPNDVFEDFVHKVEKHYRQNPFHNAVHATDVMQTVHSIIVQTGYVDLLNNLEVLCILLTALCHDIEHTGTNNSFHRNTCSELAKLYVVSILENHHLRVTLAILQQVQLLSSLTEDEFQEFKELLCSLILSTDMAHHFQLITNMKIVLNTPSTCSSRIRIRRVLLLLLHVADISNTAKPWDIHKIWVSLLCQELFDQGEIEKKMNVPVSPNCDKQTVNIATLQLGFMQTFSVESFEVLYNLMETDLNNVGRTIEEHPWQLCLDANMENWSKLALLLGPDMTFWVVLGIAMGVLIYGSPVLMRFVLLFLRRLYDLIKKGWREHFLNIKKIHKTWSSLKYAFINDLLSETSSPRKSIIGEEKEKKKRPSGSHCCCFQKERSVYSVEMTTTTVD